MLHSEGKLIDRTDLALLTVLRERRFFVLAEKYGQSPAQVRRWSDYDVERALMYIAAESPDQKFTADDVKETQKPMAAKPGYILDLDYSHWSRFITDGALDTEKLAEGNYSPDQTEYIAGEMATLGWLGGDDGPNPSSAVEQTQ